MNSPALDFDPSEFPDPGQRDLSEDSPPPPAITSPRWTSITFSAISFQALAANRVSTKRASALAYICSNILKSQSGMHDQVRFMELTAFDFLHKALQKKYFSQPASPPNSPAAPPAPNPSDAA